MKKCLILCASVVLTGTLLLTSCKKTNSDPTPTSNSVTSEDAADVVSNALSSEGSGMANQLGSSTNPSGREEGTTAVVLKCNTQYDTTFTKSYKSTNVTASVTIINHYLLKCTSVSQVSLNYWNTYTGSYNGPLMSNTCTGSTNYTIVVGNSSSTLNGTYSQKGNYSSKARNKNVFDSDLTITISNLVVNSSGQIVSGSGTFAITCSVSNGNKYNYSGKLVYNSNKTITLTMSEGNTYTVAL